MKKWIYVVLLSISLVFFGCQSNDVDTADKKEESKINNNDKESKEDKGVNDENNNGDVYLNTFYADALSLEVDYITGGTKALSDESYNFIVDNHHLFPAIKEKDINEAKKSSETIDVRLLNKNIKPHLSKIVELTGQVVQIEEEEYDNGEVAALVNLLDENWDNHHFLIFKSTGDILEEDYVSAIGLPVTGYNYNTLDGGSQNAILYFGSHIEKKQ